jgi:hypothetical protein
MKYLIPFLIFVCSVNNSGFAADSVPVTQAAKKILKPEGPIPILAWSGLPMSLSTVERFKELREAGFTHHLQAYGTLEDMRKVLGVADKTDVKLFINVLDSMPFDKFIDSVKKYPALGGYYVSDEPNADAFDELSKKVKAIQSLDTEHWCYINLLPTYAGQNIKAHNYEDYVTTFLKKVPVKVLTFDHYPIYNDYGVTKIREDFYENLEIISKSSQKAGLPFWAFALTTSHWGYPVPTLAHLRFQVYSNLAYGAQGIQYFTYWTLIDPNIDFSTGPLDQGGNRTVVYDRLKLLNREIQNLSGVFVGAKVVSVGHTGPAIPKGTKRYKAQSPFSTVETTGQGAVVSEMRKGDRRFLVVVNRDIHDSISLKITTLDLVKMFNIQKDSTIEKIDHTSNQYKIGPGDVEIFMW